MIQNEEFPSKREADSLQSLVAKCTDTSQTKCDML